MADCEQMIQFYTILKLKSAKICSFYDQHCQIRDPWHCFSPKCSSLALNNEMGPNTHNMFRVHVANLLKIHLRVHIRSQKVILNKLNLLHVSLSVVFSHRLLLSHFYPDVCSRPGSVGTATVCVLVCVMCLNKLRHYTEI